MVDTNTQASTVEAAGKLTIAAGILFCIDYFFGDLWVVIMLALGIYGVSYAGKLSVSGIKDLMEKTNNDNTRNRLQKWWYEANVPPHSKDRIADPTPEQIAEYIAWREKEEEKRKKEESKAS